MKKVLIIVLSGVSFFANAQVKKRPVVKKSLPVKIVAPAFKNFTDSFSYAMAVQVASFYKGQGVDTVNNEFIKKAFDDVYANRPLLISSDNCNITVQKKMNALMSIKAQAEQQTAQAEKEISRKFLEENKKRPGVVELPSGLQYEIIKAGTGPVPKASDTVKAHYAGSLINGKEFDNSYKRGEPIEIPVTGVIQGWVEALQLMPTGSKWKLFIPSDLGYGDRGAGGAIPGGAALIFDIELLEIVHK